ncbi:Haloalkane dehalogenase [Porphyridium purpureum]|uniref:Haloalkane dehalogenase n=1 Tax=Porphyridium purpureum TaxID=35688 RepID=A0A5J4Z9G5_PORPP|nr:Haloalkane dehalogenase [Porphyridium purpureum]|eukprot:POR8252..scf295_1
MAIAFLVPSALGTAHGRAAGGVRAEDLQRCWRLREAGSDVRAPAHDAEHEERIAAKRAERQARLDAVERGVREAPPARQAKAPSDDAQLQSEDGSYGSNATGLFGWVNNNPSSKNAVYVGSFKGDGGNVGEMVKAIRGKGRTPEGFDVVVPNPSKSKSKPNVSMYVRKFGERNASRPNRAPIVCVHGILATSWAYRALLEMLGKDGYECYAFDWVCCGYSDLVQPGADYAFKQEVIEQTFANLLTALELDDRKITLVSQGWVMNQYAVNWALDHPERVSEIVLMNGPLMPDTKLPFVLQQYKLPLVQQFVAQDAMRSERFLEAGSNYLMSVEDAERYREPFLESMFPGLAVVAIMRAYDPKRVTQALFDKCVSTDIPLRVVFGTNDKYVRTASAEQFCADTGAALYPIGNAGFTVQDDYPQEVAKAMKTFLV